MPKQLTTLQAIRANCLECNGTTKEVELCPCVKCPLYPYRLGKNPNYKKRKLTPEQMERQLVNLAAAREKKKGNT